jgi:arylsulfatase A-like enzyme
MFRNSSGNLLAKNLCVLFLLILVQLPLAQSVKPNILLVIADDFGVDASPCYELGEAKPNMPTLEQLCNQGVVFENVWATPLCTPTRASILTGQYGFRTGMGSTDASLSVDATSLQDVLKEAGYSNAVIGKWHLAGREPDPNHPSQLGIDFYSGFMSGAVRDYFAWEGVEQGKPFTSATYTTTHFTDKALEWVIEQTTPWFLWLAYNAPHSPFHLPPESLVDSNLSGEQRDIRQNPQPYYFAALEAMDKELGRLLESLPAETRENTVIFFIGDNGSPARVIQAPFRAESAKGTVYEGGVRVPLVVAGAGVSRMGEGEAALVNATDLFATIAELAGANTEAAVDSLSFVPALNGEAFAGREYIYTEIFSSGEQNQGERQQGADELQSEDAWAIRDEQLKLIHYASGEEALYNLQNDLGEQENLIEELVSEADSLRAKVEELKEQDGSRGVLY